MTDKLTLNNVSTFTADNTAVGVVNANSAAIVAAIDNTLSRDGTSPNQMGANLDMNSNRILNLPAPLGADEPVRLTELNTITGGGTVHALPSGGSTNQVLTKNSGTDFDVAWENISTPTMSGMTSDGIPIAATSTTIASSVSLTDGEILVGSSGAPTAQTMSGDVTMDDTATTTIGSGKVTGSKIATNTVANTNLAQMTTKTVKGNASGSTANAADLSQTQLTALINTATTSLSGAVPAWPNNTTTFFRGDGTYAAPASGGGSSLGAVNMFYNGSWQVNDPVGNAISTSGTTTSGLQEAINYAQTNGYSLEVRGPSITSAGSSVALIVCTTPVVFNPQQYWNFKASGCVINFSGAGLSGNSCITIGTLAYCTLDFDCAIQVGVNCTHLVQIVHNGLSPPSSNPYPEYNFIHFKILQTYAGSQTSCLCVDGTTYSVNNNIIRAEAILAGGFATYGILLPNPSGATSGIVQNQFEIGLVAGAKTTEIQIGTSSVSDPLGACLWRIGGITPDQSGMTSGLTSWGKLDVFNIGSISINAGSCTDGIYLGSSSKNNILFVGQNDLTTPMSDNGTDNVYFMGGLATSPMRIKLGLPTLSGVTGELYSNSGVVTLS